MYTFESLYACRNIRVVDGALNVKGVFTVWHREARPIVLVARVSGAKAGHPIGYAVRLVRLDAPTDEVWTRAFRAQPPSTDGTPAVLAALITEAGMITPGVYLATMALDWGQQASVSFHVK